MNAHATTDTHAPKGNFLGLTIGAIGVVYGDIGTSPLYAFREAIAVVTEHGSRAVVPEDVYGVLSMIIWALVLVVTIKYVFILLKADNHGEGGPLALMALVRSAFYKNTLFFLFVGMASAALFYGDSIITPAISVLSAVEGLKVVTPAFESYVVPITVVIIVGLFTIQSRGTGKVSAFFGPITTCWFIVLGLMGLNHIGDYPAIANSVNPYYAMRFVMEHQGLAFITLGSVFLAVTGGEALYADLGHFGRRPIQTAWIWLVFPALILNYLGQGAMILHDPSTLDSPFFKLVDEDLRLPLVILATIATIIASQAVITGAFSLTRQAVNLGILPRMVIKHTSDVNSGQIYLPQVNFMMMIGVLILVVTFRSSGSLAAAYGISVTGTMVLDAVMIFFVIWKFWNWHPGLAAAAVAPLLLIDLTFLSSNLLKIAEGGWMPLLVATGLLTIMGVWVKGTIILTSRARKKDVKIEKFVKTFAEKYGTPMRVPGTAFFLTGDPDFVPTALVQNLKHNKVLHEKNIILSVRIESVPYFDPEWRSLLTKLNDDFSVLILRFGFKEAPDVQEELIRLNQRKDIDINFKWETASLFVNRRVLRAHPRYGMPMWQDAIYIWLNKKATDPSDYYHLPVGRTIEIGRHVII